MVQSGVKVVGINNLHGMAHGGEVGTAALKKSLELKTKITLDWFAYWKENKEDYTKDLSGNLSRLLGDAQEKLETLGDRFPYQRQELVKSMAHLNSKIEGRLNIYEGDVENLFFALHPDYNQMHAGGMLQKNILVGDMDLTERISKDEEVVRRVQQEVSDPDALVIVSYGGVHMAGFYKQLVSAGVNPTPPIMPYLGEDHFKCYQPDVEICMKYQSEPEPLKDILDGQFKEPFYRPDTPQIKIPDIYGL